MNAKPSRSGSRRQASSRSRARTSIRPGFLDISDDEQIQDSESSSQAVEGDSQASLPNTTPLKSFTEFWYWWNVKQIQE